MDGQSAVENEVMEQNQNDELLEKNKDDVEEENTVIAMSNLAVAETDRRKEDKAKDALIDSTAAREVSVFTLNSATSHESQSVDVPEDFNLAESLRMQRYFNEELLPEVDELMNDVVEKRKTIPHLAIEQQRKIHHKFINSLNKENESSKEMKETMSELDDFEKRITQMTYKHKSDLNGLDASLTNDEKEARELEDKFEELRKLKKIMLGK